MTVRTACALFLLLAISGAAARAQLAPPSLKTPRLSLGISAGAPGSDSELQLKLAGPPDMEIARIEAVISLPAGALDFQTLSGSLLAAEIVKAQAKLQHPKDGRVDLLVSVESGVAGKPLPADALINIGFTVSKETPLGVLEVGLKAKAFGHGGQEAGPVEVFGGRINIQEPAVFYGCFFYMH